MLLSRVFLAKILTAFASMSFFSGKVTKYEELDSFDYMCGWCRVYRGLDFNHD